MLPVLLCVDDEMILLKSLEFELEDFFHNKLEILTAQNPEDAFEIIEKVHASQKKIFLIITDHKMGAYDGIDFLRQVHNQHPHIQKILLTGYKNKEIEQNLKKELQVHAIIEKPWSTSEIIQNVEECLNIFRRN